MSWCSYRGKRLLCCIYPGSRTDRAITEKGKLRSEMATSTKHFLKVYFFLFSWFSLEKKNLLCLAFWINLVLGRIHPYKAPPKTNQKGTSGYVVALRGLLPMGWGVGSHSASPWRQQGLAARAVPLPSHCPGQHWDSPGHRALPWGQGWAEAGTGHQPEGGGEVYISEPRAARLGHGCGTAGAAALGNPALHQAITVTLLQRLRAQLILFLFNGAVWKWEHRTWNYRHLSSPSLLPWVACKSVPQLLL